MIGPYDKIMTRLTSRLGAIGKGGNGRYRLRGRHGRKWMRVMSRVFVCGFWEKFVEVRRTEGDGQT